MKWLMLFLLSSFLLHAEGDTTAWPSRNISFGVRASLGWSGNYKMQTYKTVYRNDGPAVLFSLAQEFAFQNSDHFTFYLGLRYAQVAFYSTYVDSTYYDVTGIVAYKDSRYCRQIVSINSGIAFPLQFGSNGIEPYIGINYPLFSSLYITDRLTNEKEPTYEGAKSRGLQSEITICYFRCVSGKIKLKLGYGCTWVNDRQVIHDDRGSATDITYDGIFHSIVACFYFRL